MSLGSVLSFVGGAISNFGQGLQTVGRSALAENSGRLIERLGDAISGEGTGASLGMGDSTLGREIGGAVGAAALAGLVFGTIGGLFLAGTVASLATAALGGGVLAGALVTGAIGLGIGELGTRLGQALLGPLLDGLGGFFLSKSTTPLIVDLDGDGVELTSLEGSDAFFDLDADGFAEKTGWVSPDDGILWISFRSCGVN